MSPATQPPHIPEDDLALFAMQLLPEPEMEEIATHLQTCAVCRPVLAGIQGDLALYALTSDLKSPPAHARDQLLRRVAQEKKLIPFELPQAELPQADRTPVQAPLEASTEPVLAPRNRRSTDIHPIEDREPRRGLAFAAWSGWAIAAAAGTFAFLQFQQRTALQIDLATQSASLTEAQQTAHAQQVLKTLTDAGALRVSLHQPGGPPPKVLPEASATYVAGTGSLVMVADHLNQLTADKTYELWLLPAEKGVAPIPAGTFRPDTFGNASVVMPTLPPGTAAKGFAVTIENEGGSPTPTSAIILAGF
jgi:hypothetical protein